MSNQGCYTKQLQTSFNELQNMQSAKFSQKNKCNVQDMSAITERALKLHSTSQNRHNIMVLLGQDKLRIQFLDNAYAIEIQSVNQVNQVVIGILACILVFNDDISFQVNNHALLAAVQLMKYSFSNVIDFDNSTLFGILFQLIDNKRIKFQYASDCSTLQTEEILRQVIDPFSCSNPSDCGKDFLYAKNEQKTAFQLPELQQLQSANAVPTSLQQPCNDNTVQFSAQEVLDLDFPVLQSLDSQLQQHQKCFVKHLRQRYSDVLVDFKPRYIEQGVSPTIVAYLLQCGALMQIALLHSNSEQHFSVELDCASPQRRLAICMLLVVLLSAGDSRIEFRLQSEELVDLYMEDFQGSLEYRNLRQYQFGVREHLDAVIDVFMLMSALQKNRQIDMFACKQAQLYSSQTVLRFKDCVVCDAPAEPQTPLALQSGKTAQEPVQKARFVLEGELQQLELIELQLLMAKYCVDEWEAREEV